MDRLRPTSGMDCFNVAVLDTPSPSATPKQDYTKAPFDFCHLTPSQFGITSNSFSVPSKPKDKSRVSQLKARRRSTIGVRGSPETNSLIRYIAKQRMQAPSPTTEHLRLQSSLPRSQTLKQKMAAFQIVMEEVDEERKLELMITPGKSDHKLDCIGASNTHSDELDSPLGKENRAVAGYLAKPTPPPSKRLYRGPLQECEGKIRGALFSLPECNAQEKVRAFDFTSTACVDTALHQQVQHMSLPVLSQQSKASLNRRDGPGVSSVTKKKRVHFGAPLSPEFFDKALPPSTPLQKGGTPLRRPTSAGSNLRSLLKTPQRDDVSLPQLDFNSPEAAGGSPMLSQSKVLEGAVSSGIVFRDASEDEVPRLILEENEMEPLSMLKSAGISEDVFSDELTSSQEDVVTSLFQSEAFLEEQAGTEPEMVSSPQQKHQPSPPSSSPPLPPLQQQDLITTSSPARPRGRKRKQPPTETEAAAAAAAESESEPQPERRPSCAASTSASGKKTPRSARKRVRFGAHLSPEFFDKTLPPSTPLQRGGTPFRQPSSSGTKLCSVLKTPQRDKALLSPTLSHTADPHSALSTDLMPQEAEQQFPRLLLEEDDEVTMGVKSADIVKDASPDELADAQAPDSSSHPVEPVLEKQMAGVELELASSLQKQQLSPPPSPPSSSPPPLPLLQQLDPSTSSSGASPARPRCRKRKPAAAVVATDAESEPQPARRRPSRSAALSASGKMKDSAGKRRFGTKDVNRALYGKREYASKNPLLSPIFESQPAANGGVTPALDTSGTSTGEGIPLRSLPTSKSQSDVITAATRWCHRFCPQPIPESSEASDITEALQDTTESPPEAPVAASSSTPRSRGRPRSQSKLKAPKAEAAPAVPTNRRSRGRRSGGLLRPDPAAAAAAAATQEPETQSAVEEHDNESGQDKGQIHPPAGSQSPGEPVQNQHENSGLGPSPRRSPENNTRRDAAHPSFEPLGETQDQTATNVLSRESPATEGDEGDGKTPQHHEPACPAGKKRGARAFQGRARRRSSRLQLDVLGEEEDGNGEEEEKRGVHQPTASSGMEDSSRADVTVKGSDGEGLENGNGTHTGNASLAPWLEEEFSVEDVFRPVASRRPSVRRSLRNRSERPSKPGATGLAWVAHTSPDTDMGGRPSRRRTSSRCSISLQPPELPELPPAQNQEP